MKLNQLISIITGRKNAFNKAISELYHDLQKPDKLRGFIKTYRPINEEGLSLPDEKKEIQLTIRNILERTSSLNADLLNSVGSQDFANVSATGDIVVHGETLMSNVPVPYLLFLEKRLVDIATMVDKLPTLDQDKNWTANGDGTYSSNSSETHRTQRVSEPIVLYEATAEHPAQTQLVEKDSVVGFWTTVHNSGAISLADKDSLRRRVTSVLEAVKSAREEANSVEVLEVKPGTTLMDFIFNND